MKRILDVRRLLLAGLLLSGLMLQGADAQLTLLQTIPLHDPGNGDEPWGIAASPVDHRVYVACIHGPHELMVVDALGDSIVDRASLTGPYPHGVEVSAAGDRVYVASSGGSVSIVDAHTLEETHVTALTGTPMDLCLFGAAATSPRLYVVDMHGARVWVLDATDGTPLHTIEVGNYPCDVCAMEETGRIYVANLSDWTVSVIDATADTVTATIPVGAYPEGIACDPDLNLIYTANRDDNSVSVIDGATDTVIATHAVGAKPRKLAVDPVTHAVFVANSEDNSVSVLPPFGPLPEPAAVGMSPYGGLCVDPVLGRVFVTNIDSDDVTALNTTPPWATGTIRLRCRPRSVALAGPWGEEQPERPTVLVANGFGNDLMHVDPQSATLARRFLAGYAPQDMAGRLSDGLVAAAIGMRDELLLFDWETGAATDTVLVGDDPYGLAIRETPNRIYVTNHESCDLSVYDVDSARIIDTVALPDGWVAHDVALNESADKIYVTTWWAWLWFLDGTTHEVLDRIALHGFCEIDQIAVDEERQLIYVTAVNCPAMWVVDAATHEVLQELGLPGYPTGVAVNPALQRAYVTAGDGLISIGPDHAIADQVCLPGTALRCAVDPSRRRIYVSGDQDGCGVLYEILDGEPSGVVGGGGHDGAQISAGLGIDLRVVSSQPRTLGAGRVGDGVCLRLNLARAGRVEVGVYDVCGRMVHRIAGGNGAGIWAPGAYLLQWEGNGNGPANVPPGVYYVAARLRVPDAVERQVSAKVVLVQ